MLRHLPVVNFMKIVSFFKMPTDNDSTCKRFNECVLSYGTGRQRDEGTVKSLRQLFALKG